MKINWGTSIVISFALFVAFIMYFVFTVQGNSRYDNELVVEEYYKHDARFGEEFAKLRNAAQLSQPPAIRLVREGILVSYPDSFSQGSISGNLSLYRPSAKKLDFSRPLKLSNGSMLVPAADLTGGRWDVTLEWTFEGKSYLIKKPLYVD
ncbi:cytochrome C oxidase Cbb3 [Flavobacterium magnum]|uniref:Cytochrome C oxidase Cbb3 n=1 Tax=Flavobacterium magnum TaxID=2162713 RepID=A0A2S0RJM8_9FLAO|nr:FixH family protein [Flavobacterium magnum]AWA30922.1 cytochrome C oxidase Cbb3 [Flavobacterium magnum]